MKENALVNVLVAISIASNNQKGHTVSSVAFLVFYRLEHDN